MIRKIKLNWNLFKDLKFEEEKHIYTLNNQILKSCTQFISQYKTNIFTEDFISNYCVKHNYEIEYIKTLWDIKRQVSAIKGTELHFYIESFLKYNIKNDISIQNTKEMNFFHNFIKDHSNLKFIKSEYRIFDMDLKIAGTIDCIFQDINTKKYIIVDWKTNKKIKKFSKNRFKYPLNDLYQNDYNIYSLQLSMYKYILEKNLNINISDLWLIHFNYNNSNYVKLEIPFLDSYIKKLF